MYLLKDKTNQIKIINASEIYNSVFNIDYSQYHPVRTGEISPDKLLNIYEEAKAYSFLSSAERKYLEKELVELWDNNSNLSIYLNGHIKGVSEDYYDKYIIDTIKRLQDENTGYFKVARVIGDIMGNLEQDLGDSYFLYRLKQLIKNKVVDYEGTLEAIRFFSVRMK